VLPGHGATTTVGRERHIHVPTPMSSHRVISRTV
jgi:hypothetical protein